MSSSPVSSKPAFPSPREPAASAEPRKEPPRQQAEARSARERFASRLDQGSERFPSGSDRPDSTNRNESGRIAGEREGERGGSGDGSGGGSGGGDDRGGGQHDHTLHGAHALTLTGIANISAPASASAPVIDLAMLERMAAQIAESWPSVGAEAMRIEFPAGAIAQSALVSRAADGSLAIRIAGIDPKLSALHHAQLQIQLAGALNRRRLRIGSLNFENAAQTGGIAQTYGRARKDASAMPRVV